MTPEQRATILRSLRNLRHYYYLSFSAASEAFNKGNTEQDKMIRHLGRLKETDRQIKELEG